MYHLYLVNHTLFEYVDLCRSNFSQERTYFVVPSDWDGHQNDMEVMTEFVFREKLKHRKKYTEVEMLDDIDDEETEDDDDEETEKEEHTRKKITCNEDDDCEVELDEDIVDD